MHRCGLVVLRSQKTEEMSQGSTNIYTEYKKQQMYAHCVHSDLEEL